MHAFIAPMLATAGRPFASEEYVFEVKYDGVRALAAVSATGWHLWGRGGADYTTRYPDLELLRRLPAGTTVDGELILLQQGLPDLHALLRRHALRQPAAIAHASRCSPVGYVLFDLLALHGRCLLSTPLEQRRAALADLLGTMAEPALLYSAGVIGTGETFFERVVQAGHEGVMAKRSTSRYCPGQRSAAWQKIKPVQQLPCVIVGYAGDTAVLRRLLVAAVWQGRLRYAATLTSGLHSHCQGELLRRLQLLRRAQPVVCCPQPAVWVAPDVYCQVAFRRRAADGRLVDAAFAGLIDGAPESSVVAPRR